MEGAHISEPPVNITLYVAGTTGKAAETIGRLTSDAATFGSMLQLEVVDVLDDPARAENDGILATPMLVRWSPAPVRRMTGDIPGIASVLPRSDDGSPVVPERRKSGSAKTELAKDEGAIVSRAAHELRTPLAVIRGFASTLVDAVESMDRDTEMKCAEAIVRGSVQLQAILDSMLVMDQVERDGLRLQMTHLMLGELVLETVRDLQSLTGKHSVSVDVLEEVEVRADASKVRQIITNLVSNAAKFSPAGSSIQIEVEATESGGKVKVQDTGPGIAEEKLDKVFQQYERLGSSVKGMGLGLYISRRLALAHEGDLTVCNADTGGACFELTLPAS